MRLDLCRQRRPLHRRRSGRWGHVTRLRHRHEQEWLYSGYIAGDDHSCLRRRHADDAPPPPATARVTTARVTTARITTARVTTATTTVTTAGVTTAADGNGALPQDL
jgi:hypothetical protein